MLKVFANTFGGFLHTAQMTGSCFDQLQLGASRRCSRYRLLDIGVRHFVWVQFWTIARKIEHFDLIHVLCQPCLDGLAVVNPQVVQDQEDFLGRAFDQASHEVNQ